MAKRGIRFEHSVGEVVLCFEPDPTKARVLYDAKVLDSQVSKDKQGRKCAAYLVHFQGWNNSWDRLVPESFILKATETNKTLMKRLTDTAKKQYVLGRKNRQRRRKIDNLLREANVKAPPQYDTDSDTDSSGSDDDSDSDNDSNQSHLENGRKRVRKKQQPKHSAESSSVHIDIPDILKSRLEDDYTAVSIRGKLVSVPAKPCVVDILEGFMKTFCVNYVCEPVERDPLLKERDKTKAENFILRLPADYVFAMCKELVDGLRILFDFTLPIILLYASEQEQYEFVMKNTKIEETFASPDIDKYPTPPETKARRGRPPGPKSGSKPETKSEHKSEREEMDEACGVAETLTLTRRMTRRSTVDSHFSDEPQPACVAPATKKAKKLDGGLNLSPRALRRRGLHEEPLAVKVEDNSDTEIEFSPPASCSTTNNGTSQPWGHQVVVTDREDLTHSILTWQIVPPDVRRQSPVFPSHVYGIQHLLRLFVKLPELLNRMPFDDSKLDVLVKLCHHCLQYLVDHQQEFFS